MEKSRIKRGGELINFSRAALALGLAAIASVGIKIISKNKRNPQERGGWTPLEFSEMLDSQEQSID